MTRKELFKLLCISPLAGFISSSAKVESSNFTYHGKVVDYDIEFNWRNKRVRAIGAYGTSGNTIGKGDWQTVDFISLDNVEYVRWDHMSRGWPPDRVWQYECELSREIYGRVRKELGYTKLPVDLTWSRGGWRYGE